MFYSLIITRRQATYTPLADNPLSLNIKHLSDLIKHFCVHHKRRAAGIRSLSMMICLVHAGWVHAGFEDHLTGSRWQAMAGSGVALADGSALWMHNPAVLASGAGWQAAFSHLPLFAMRELTLLDMDFQLRKRRWGVGMAFQSLGNDLYRESTMAAGMGCRLAEKVHAGVAVRRADLTIKNYGNASCFLIDIGLIGQWSDSLDFGFSIKNISGARLGQCQEPLPQSLQMGLSVHSGLPVRLGIDLYKETRLPMQVRAGVEYKTGSFLCLRAGMTSASWRVAAGLGLKFSFMNIDYAVVTHPYLGLTHQFSVIFAGH